MTESARTVGLMKQELEYENMKQLKTASIFCALLFAVACTSTMESSDHHDSVRPLRMGQMQRLHASGDILLASQPDATQLRMARDDHGVKSVINLRLPDEGMALREEEIADELGLKYYNPGFRAPETLTDEIFSEVRRILSNPENKPAMMHCKSANRVGAVWYAYRVLDEGVDPVTAMQEARRVGLRHPGHIARASAYVDARN